MNSYTVFLILIVIVAFLLVAVIMVQNPKGGGLASSFGGSGTQQLGGVKQTTDFLDKSTWYLAITLIVLILLSNVTFNNNDADVESKALDSQEIVEDQVPLNLPNEDTPEDINLGNSSYIPKFKERSFILSRPTNFANRTVIRFLDFSIPNLSVLNPKNFFP